MSLKFPPLAALCAFSLLLCACDDMAGSAANDAANAPPTATAAAPADIAPVKEIADTSYLTPASAADFVRDYYAALNQHDYSRAYGFWADNGKASYQDFPHFRDGYANIDWVDAKVGSSSRVEGAAGSRYARVPVQVTMRMTDGSTRDYEGRYTLRAIVAEGSEEKLRHWHFASADFTRLPDAADKAAAAQQP